MELADYLANDAVGLSALVRSGDVTPEELRTAAVEQHLRTHGDINAIVEWYDDPARTVDLHGPLLGVPFLRKDVGSAEAGRLVERGSRLTVGDRAETGSRYFDRMLAAGVQVLGRTAVPEFAQHGTTESKLWGPTRNPLDPALSSGGSSGGAASAVRAGVVPIAHASDAAGSIRIPAAVTGLYGLKPSRDLIPSPPDDWCGLLTEFVLGRSIRDLETCLDVLVDRSLERSPAISMANAGAPTGSTSRPTPVGRSPDGERRLRVAVSAQHWAGLDVDPAVSAAVSAAAARLEGLGHSVELIACPFDYARLMTTWFPLFGLGVVRSIEAASKANGRPADDAHLEPNTLELMERVAALGPDAEASARVTASVITEQLEAAAAASFEVLLTPTLDQVSIPLQRIAGDAPMDRYLVDGDRWFSRQYLANVTGWAAMSVPVPGSDPHPIGIQLMARPGGERRLLALARQLTDDAVIPASAPSAIG